MRQISKIREMEKFVEFQASKIRAELEDLNDYLDLIEARVRNEGKPRHTTIEIRKKLDLA